MRQLKFRAWDKTNNKWYMEGDTFDLNYSGSYGDFFFNNDHPSNMRSVKLEWVQFTGLHDKQGNEIYEGDIVRWITLELPVTVDDFHGYRFMFGKDNLCRAVAIEGEVIGNIYESLD